MKIKVSFSRHHYQELVQRANYLGISRTAAILLHLYVYADIYSDLSQESLVTQREDSELFTTSIQVLIPDDLVAAYEGHKTYFLSGSAYFTGFINAVLEETKGDWQVSEHLQERTSTTLYLDRVISEQAEAFSKQTGLQFSVIAAYYLTYAQLDYDKRTCESTDKVQFGIRLTKRAHDSLKVWSSATNQKPNQVLSIGFQDFIDKKVLPRGY